MTGKNGRVRDTSAGVIGCLFRAELRMLLRDRRTLIVSILLPLLIMPLLLLAGNWTDQLRQRRLDEREYAYAVVGPLSHLAEEQVSAIERRLEEERLDEDESGQRPFSLSRREVDDPMAALDAGEIQFYLEAREGEAQEGEAPEEATRIDDADVQEEAAPVLRVIFRGDVDESESGARRLMSELRTEQRSHQYELMRQAGFAGDPERLVEVTEKSLAEEGQITGLLLGRILPVFVLLFVLMGGAVVATDSLAGEKERGTLETLLTTAVGRRQIVTAKFLLIFAVSVVVVLIQAANFLVYVGFELVPLPEGFTLAVNPAVSVLVFLLLVPMAAVCSAVLILVSGNSSSYKEAQFNLAPVMLLGLLPAAVTFLPGLELRSAIVFVPVANVAMAVKETLTGVFDWPMIALAWLITSATAVAVGARAARLLSAEHLIAPATAAPIALLPPEVAFRRRVYPAFFVMWVALFLFAVNRPPDWEITVDLFVNLGVIFAGGAVFLMRKYRLPVVETLSLRPVRPIVWPAVLVGVPAAMLTGEGVFLLADFLIPMPPEMIEAFSTAIFPEHLSTFSLILLIGLAPGVLEEVAFRGVLLHGMRGKYGTENIGAFVKVVLINGLIFGLFHITLFRILPTAFLGVVFAGVTLLTGSIFPAVVWHTLNNVLALILTRAELEMPAFLGGWIHAAGAVVLIGAFWVIARYGPVRSR